MLRGQIPPQGYAKDVLVQAFQWLQAQPETIKNQAISADALVALYNRARRNGAAGDAPVSSERFRSDLKDIASELENFSDPKPVVEKPVPTRQLPLEFQKPAARFAEEPREERPARVSSGLDDRTLEMLEKVKAHLNLSTETEALRMLVTLGFERLQNLFR